MGKREKGNDGDKFRFLFITQWFFPFPHFPLFPFLHGTTFLEPATIFLIILHDPQSKNKSGFFCPPSLPCKCTSFPAKTASI